MTVGTRHADLYGPVHPRRSAADLAEAGDGPPLPLPRLAPAELEELARHAAGRALAAWRTGDLDTAEAELTHAYHRGVRAVQLLGELVRRAGGS